jgi:hypothetical protein
MVELSQLLAPAFTLILAVLVGVAFSFAPAKTRQRKTIPLIAFALSVGIAALVVVFAFNQTLTGTVYTISLFQSFAAIFENASTAIIKYNAQLVAAIILIATIEIGLTSGFGTAFAIGNRQEKRRATKAETAAPPAPASTTADLTPSTPIASTPYSGPAKTIDPPRDQQLSRDEQNLMELFLFGKVNQINPKVDLNKPEGYFYEGIPQLDWDTKHSRQVLDSLVRKGYLTAELIDKITLCQTCGSGSIRLVKVCPECGSLRLHKEGLIEHFSCGAVERQSAFEGKNGDLICPKCKAKLNLIGSDYRILPPAYKCLGCNTLNSEPKLVTKCAECSSTAELDEEPEILLYKYTANPQMPLTELQRIKPIDSVAQFFKSLGYTIVAPAFVSGRSGTQHLFDMLILGRVGWIEPQKSDATPNARNDNGNTAVEVLISGKPINLGEVTRIYGKISDIDTDFILFAIPGLTANARNYAKAYGLKVSEGKSIEEALANSKIPKIPGAKQA